MQPLCQHTWWQCVLALALECGPLWCDDGAGSSLGQASHPEVTRQAEAAGACSTAQHSTAWASISLNLA
jgi:hypothetical protein